MLPEIEKKSFTLERATVDHAALLFQWANDNVVRQNAIHQQAIVWESHIKWLESKFATASEIFILYVKGQPAGQIRFDFSSEENYWFIDYSISSEFRGRGLGKVIVSLGMTFLNKYPIVAFVKCTNIPSIKVFETLNFKKVIVNLNRTPYIKFIKQEPDKV